MARPTVMTDDVVKTICTKLACGESLRSICRDESMPAVSTVLLSVVQDRNGFRSSYTRAREAAGYAHADGIVEIVEELRGESGLEPQVAKVMIDGLKWAAERMAPKAHGSQQKIDHTSSDGTMSPQGKNLDDFYKDVPGDK